VQAASQCPEHIRKLHVGRVHQACRGGS
jgi:hypothetical protein